MITFAFDSSTEFKQHPVKHKIIPFSSLEQARDKATENQIPVQIQAEILWNDLIEIVILQELKMFCHHMDLMGQKLV